jgi:hypothetical protein
MIWIQIGSEIQISFATDYCQLDLRNGILDPIWIWRGPRFRVWFGSGSCIWVSDDRFFALPHNLSHLSFVFHNLWPSIVIFRSSFAIFLYLSLGYERVSIGYKRILPRTFRQVIRYFRVCPFYLPFLRRLISLPGRLSAQLAAYRHLHWAL